MKKITSLCIYALIAATPVMASAQQHSIASGSSDVYLNFATGVSVLSDSDIKGGTVNRSADFNVGPLGVAAVGYTFGNGLRGELELGYRRNSADSVTGANASGDASATTLMGNVLFDFAGESALTPYVGMGAGGAWVNMDKVGPLNTPGSQVKDRDFSPALQGIVGANYALNDALSLFADYRYLTALDLEMKTNTGQNVDVDYDNNSLLVGVRVALGGASAASEPDMPMMTPPPVATPPVRTEARTYMVFFDFDKSSITPEADSILRNVAAGILSGQVARINITGHTDRAGSDRYNMRLSERRADAVRKRLVSLGVPAMEIKTFAKGEHELLKLTPDGVREPQNRRAEIIYTINGR